MNKSVKCPTCGQIVITKAKTYFRHCHMLIPIEKHFLVVGESLPQCSPKGRENTSKMKETQMQTKTKEKPEKTWWWF